jgi:hypothetical protein
MSVNKEEATSKTISFRLPAGVVNKIRASAVEMKMTVQEYFLSQVLATSPLGQILEEEQQKILNKSKGIAEVKERMASDALKLRESMGLSEDELVTAMSQAMKMLISNNKEDSK